MWKVWTKIHLCIKLSMAFTVPIIMKLTVTQYMFVAIFCTKIYPHQTKNVKDKVKISVTPV